MNLLDKKLTSDRGPFGRRTGSLGTQKKLITINPNLTNLT